MSLGITTPKQTAGQPVQVAAGGYPKFLPVGVTVAWGLVTAAVSDTVLDDGTPVFTGEKAIRYGTVMVPITVQEVQTVDLSGGDDPTGGTFDLKVLGETLTELDYDISAADLQTAIRALDVDHAKDVTVSKSNFVYTITFPAALGNVAAITADATDLTSSGTATITVTTTTAGSEYGGQWAPYDSAKSDGRQTLTRGSVGILNTTIKEHENTILGGQTNDTDLVGLIEGELVYRERLAVGGSGQPTLSDLLEVMPLLRLTPAE